MFALARELSSRGLQITCALPATSYASYCNNNASQITSNPFQVKSVGESADHDSSNDHFLLQKKLEEGLVHLMQLLQPRPTCLIADLMYCTWSQEVADRLGVRLFLFSVFSATAVLVSCYIPELLKEGILPFQPSMQDKVIDHFIPGLMEGFHLGDVPLDFLGRSAAELEAFNFLQHCKTCAGLIMCNTSYALDVEAEALDALIAHGLRIFPMAPMLHMAWTKNSSLLYREDDKCLSWLDRQPSGSVVYASFGGIISLTPEEIQELALGLETCGQPFLWVVRRKEGGSDVCMSDVLPQGFLERINDRGRIVSWAPQMAVLSHPSVGCFLFHGGTASLMEGLLTGVPMIGGFHKISEQNTVFKIMTDGWKVALPLRSKAHAALRSSIEAAIKEVMHVGEQGTEAAIDIRCRIKHLKAALTKAAGPSGVSRRYLDQFVDIFCSPAKQEISST